MVTEVKKDIILILLMPVLLPAVLGFSSIRAFAFDHGDYDALLKKYVHNGLVNYQELKNHRSVLDNYLKKVAGLRQPELEKLSKPDQLAFYINAYNAVTLSLIINHYPPSSPGKNPRVSILNIDGAWKKIKSQVAGEMITLDDLEHRIIRKKFDEPRIHFALVCAARGCPVLISESYKGDRLESQLSEVTKMFFADKHKNFLKIPQKQVFLSSIFDWYGDDFINKYGDNSSLNKRHGRKLGAVLNLFSRFLPSREADFILTDSYQVKFSHYDWTLNSR